MRIAIVLPPREHLRGPGMGAVALTVVDQSRRSRFRERITLFTGTSEGDEVLDTRSTSLSRWRLRSQTSAYARAIAQAIGDGDYGLVEVHNRAKLFHILSKRLAHIPMVLTLHNDPWTMKGLKRPGERTEVLRRSAAIVCISEYVRERYLHGVDELTAEERGRVVVIPNALERMPTANLERKGNEILFVGRVVPEKGGLLLAQSLVRVLPKHPGWRARFIGAARFGQTAPRTAYEFKIIETMKPILGQVDYMNAQPHERVMQAFAEASIAVIPSLCNEAFGRSLLEAMACGCACITSGRGGLAEVAGDAALIVDVENPHVFDAALESLMSDEQKRRSLQFAAMLRAQESFDVKRSVDRLDALRAKLLG